MSDLVTWLRAQLDADEQTARDALHNRIVLTVAKHAGKTGAHAFWFRHDPARVLRQVAAMRAIVDRHSRTGPDHWSPGACEGCGFTGDPDLPRTADYDVCPELADLATIYADRDGYRPEWSAE